MSFAADTEPPRSNRSTSDASGPGSERTRASGGSHRPTQDSPGAVAAATPSTQPPRRATMPCASFSMPIRPRRKVPLVLAGHQTPRATSDCHGELAPLRQPPAACSRSLSLSLSLSLSSQLVSTSAMISTRSRHRMSAHISRHGRVMPGSGPAQIVTTNETAPRGDGGRVGGQFGSGTLSSIRTGSRRRATRRACGRVRRRHRRVPRPDPMRGAASRRAGHRRRGSRRSQSRTARGPHGSRRR